VFLNLFCGIVFGIVWEGPLMSFDNGRVLGLDQKKVST
jgi:hypothetical protein